MSSRRTTPPLTLPHPSQPKRSHRLRVATVFVLLLAVIPLCISFLSKGRVYRVAAGVYRRARTAQQERQFAAQVSPLTISRPKEPLVLYADGLGDSWQNWSWASVDLEAKEPVQAGKTALRMTPQEWKAVSLHHDALRIDGYGTLQFYIHHTGTPASLRVSLVEPSGEYLKGALIAGYSRPVPGGTGKAAWNVVRIPLADLGAAKSGTTITGVVIQANGPEKQADVFLDSIAFLPDTGSAPDKQPAVVTVPVTIDPQQDRHAISPYIYGMAFAPPDYVNDLRLGANRWGGNDRTRYNWVHGNASNAARDWNFANRVAVDTPGITDAPSSAADRFVRDNTAGGAATMLTVPAIGWVARDTDNNHRSTNVPGEGGAGKNGDSRGAIEGYDPSANRTATSVPSFARKGRPFTASPARESAEKGVYQDEWIYHLTKEFGTADKGGVPLYAIDNEPDLWDGTHTDVHPARMGYDDLLAQFLLYARAVKDVDPAAKITGPVSWGWTGYLYSPLDRGTDNFKTAADRMRHGNDPFLLWFLKQVRAADAAKKSRSLDVLDVHYYPQASGLYNGTATDPATFERRIRSTRSLWDPTYTDESWIGKPIALIPLLQNWITQGYPGTRIGITEWNFGGDKDISGALAIAETLGVYGRGDVYLANYWAYPPKDSPGYLAFKLFRNADGQGHGFGDQSFRAQSSKPELVSCYAATDTRTGSVTLLLINKMPDTAALVPLASVKAGGAIAWRLDARNLQKLTPVSGDDVWAGGTAAGSAQAKLPPYSITLIRLPAGPSAPGSASRK